MLKQTRDHTNIVFRTDIRPSDLVAVRTIAESTGFFSEEELDIAVELLEDRMERGRHSEYRFILADLDGRPVGFASYGHIACTLSSYDLYWIAVQDEQRGRGIGKQLMTETERKIVAEGGTRIYVETSSREQYASTRAFYEQGGYVAEAVQKDFYAPGDGKVTYVKTL